jgi:hypothetical protein
MDTNTLILLAAFVVFVALYIARRKSRIRD